MQKIASSFGIGVTKKCAASMILVAIAGCGDLCGNEEVSRTNSPTGELSVVVFVRECGATTGWSWQASLLRSDEPLSNRSGNILTTAGSPSLDLWKIQWVGDDVVTITIPSSVDIRNMNKSVRGVKINYRILST